MILAAALALAQAPPIASMSNSELCRLMRQTREFIETPIELDAGVRLDRVSVDCGDRTFVWDVAISEEAAELAAEAFEARLDQTVCSNPLLGPSVRRGWRVRQNLSLPSGEQATREITAC